MAWLLDLGSPPWQGRSLPALSLQLKNLHLLGLLCSSLICPVAYYTALLLPLLFSILVLSVSFHCMTNHKKLNGLAHQSLEAVHNSTGQKVGYLNLGQALLILTELFAVLVRAAKLWGKDRTGISTMASFDSGSCWTIQQAGRVCFMVAEQSSRRAGLLRPRLQGGAHLFCCILLAKANDEVPNSRGGARHSIFWGEDVAKSHLRGLGCRK